MHTYATTMKFCLYPVFLLLTTFSVTSTTGSSASLTVKEGVSLIGTFCPENITLLCDGTEITSLRWRYNGNMDIISYFPDGRSTTQLDSTEFFTVELRAFKQNPNLLNVANFSATLSVNLLRLSNITEISCGSSGIFQVLPVNVSIIGPSIPDVPRITMVSAEYLFGQLNSVEVTWNRPVNICPSYGLTSYEVNITVLDFVKSHSLSCDESLCMTSFNNLIRGAEPLVISIKAGNELGTSDVIHYPTPIAQQIQEYFIPEAYLENGQLFGRCSGVGETIQSNECIIQYTTDPIYQNLSSGVVTSLDKEILLLDFVTSRTYYLQFSVLVDSFELINRVSIDFSAPDGALPAWAIAVIVIVILIVSSLAIVTIILIVALLCKGTKIQNVTVECSGTGREKKSSVSSAEQVYLKYKVTVTSTVGIPYDLEKRFSDFRNLHTQIKKNCKFILEKDGSLKEFNIKELTKDKEDDFKPEDKKKEQERLQNYLNKLLKIKGAVQCPPVREFFSRQMKKDIYASA